MLRWPFVGKQTRGAVAISDIAPLDTIVEIPEVCMISEATARRDSFLGPIYKKHPHLFRSDDNVLTIYLMRQLNLGEGSFFSPYLKILQTPDTPMHWNEKELGQIQHT